MFFEFKKHGVLITSRWHRNVVLYYNKSFEAIEYNIITGHAFSLGVKKQRVYL